MHLPRAAYGMSFAHFGLAVSVAGFSASAFDVEAIDTVHAGSVVQIAGYELRFAGVARVPGPNYTADQASVEIRRDGALVALVHPERRFFPLQQPTSPSHWVTATKRATGRCGCIGSHWYRGSGSAQCSWHSAAWSA
jgi:cytochrome c-type biogenesis protein CcmF